MSLNRLCFVLPDDTDETKPPPSTAYRSKRRISAAARRTLHRFCHRRWHGLCGCFSDDRNDSSHFEDTPGVDDGEPNKQVRGSNPRLFSYAELYIGTSGFSDGELLGNGGFGSVYRAVLPRDASLVAVKRVAGTADRFQKSFAAELAAVAQLRHRNLVRLRGWCVHDDDRSLLLVYDYMPNRSLDRLLFGTSPAAAAALLPWKRRQNIVTGLAASLFYLHEQLDTQIIHRDVKASNVMLDSDYNARLGDFGLARWLEHSDHQLELSSVGAAASMSSSSTSNYQFRLTETSRIGGTIGYLAPESFQKRGGATVKSDVFSFGVVVLEVATGRRAVDLAYPDDEIFMLDWVRRLSDEGKLLSAGDQRLPDGSYPLSEMERLIHLGLLCSLHDPKSRPTMKWVMENVSRAGAGDLPAVPSFHSQPLYISLSSGATTETDTTTKYLTAPGATVYLTAAGSLSSHENPSPSLRSASMNMVDTPREIPYKEIIAITNNFSEGQMVAELDFGTGYHGYLDRRIHVLVKRLGMKTCPALRTRFSNELHNLGRLRHRHLVQLRGWCTEQGEMLVVYDYSSRTPLSHRLFHGPALAWRHRYAVVKSLASAVRYLHEEWEEQVIHQNITSSAVFLDPDMNPRLGSFALAEFLARNEPAHHAGSSARGIFGYMSPEYMESGEATTMADIYGFGVVVLEVVTGMMAVDLRWPEALLVRRVRGFEAMKRPLVELADRRLEGRFDCKELMRLARLGSACTRCDPQSRPNTKQIVRILDGDDAILDGLGNGKREGREHWEERNAAALHLVRRMKALGIN